MSYRRDSSGHSSRVIVGAGRKTICSRFKILYALLLSLGITVFSIHEALSLPVARLKNVRPVVEVRSGRMAPFRLVRTRQAVGFGNTLRTGPTGMADILFSNGTELAMRRNTQIEIVAPAAPGNPLVVRVFGALSEVFVRRRGNIRIDTAAAIAAASGTEFLVRLPTADSTEVTVTEGTVNFFNPQGAVVVNAGEQSTAKVGQAPTPPRAVDVTGLLEWTADITGVPINLELPGDGQSTLAVQNALALAGNNRLAEARAALEPLAQAGDRNAALPLTALGLLALQNGEVDAALTRLQEAVVRDPQLAQARSLLALAQLNINQVAEAEQSAREAAQLNPRSSLAQSTLAYVLFFRGNAPEAERAARRAGELDPLSPFALLTQGRVLLSQLKTDEARQAFAQAAALAPNLPLAHIELAQADLRLDQLPQAERSFRRAVELQPASAAANVGLGVSLQRQGRTQDALALYRQVLLSEPNNAQARGNVAQLLLEEGRLDEARRELEQAGRDKPESGILYVRLAETALYQQNLTAAQEFARTAVAILPNSALARYQLGRVYLEQNRFLQAENEFRQAATLDTQFAAARYALGVLRERTESGPFARFNATSVLLGSAAGSISLQSFETPGAEERIQAALADPTVVRTASRSFGDTQFNAEAGQDDVRQLELSHLDTTPDRRGVRGLVAQHFETDGVRANADRTFDRASLVFGQKARTGGSGVFVLGQFRREDEGQDYGETPSRILASTRERLRFPRVLVGGNLQGGERQRTRALLQWSRPKNELIDLQDPTSRSQFNFSSFNGEVRHDARIGDRHLLTAGLFAGSRRQNGETRFSIPSIGLDFQSTLRFHLQPYGAYVRDEIQATERLRVTTEMQVQRLAFNFASQDILPAPEPPTVIDEKATVGLPKVIFDYRPDPRSHLRLSARKLFGSIQDFQLLTPTDVFLFSLSGLPEARPLGRGSSIELEYDYTFRNASFLRFGVFTQRLQRATISNEPAATTIDKATVRGARLSYEGFLGRDISYFTALDLNQVRNTATGQPVPTVPRLVAAAGLQYLNPRGFFFEPSLTYIGRRVKTLSPARLDTGGFGLLNLRAGQRWGLRSLLFVEFSNALDKRYAVQDRVQAGRHLRFGATRRF